MATKQLKTKDMGEISYTERDTFTFETGLIGLPDLKHFVLLEKNEKFGILQSIEDPDMNFLVTEPTVWNLHMSFQLDPQNMEHVQYKEGNELWVLYIVHLPDGKPEKMSMNLSGPLVINLANHMGVQQVTHAPMEIDKDKVMCLQTDEALHHMGHLREDESEARSD